MSFEDALRPHVVTIAARAAELDEAASFPADDIALLASLGLPSAALPHSQGGAGAGTEPAGLAAIFELLRLLGRANMSVGRLFEAHVNVVRLVTRFGTPEQLASVAKVCRAGALFGLWVTDAPGQALRLTAGSISGTKGPCSGAGHLHHALVTVTEGEDVRMALIDLQGTEPVQPLGPRLHGMRASANGTVQLDGMHLTQAALLGAPGDYLREPDFSTGAWRTMAVILGGLEALTEAVRAPLVARRHDKSPLQQARFGELLIAQETARLWTERAAEVAELGIASIPEQIATVNLARIAVETAALEAMRHAQRALGLAALVRPTPRRAPFARPDDLPAPARSRHRPHRSRPVRIA